MTAAGSGATVLAIGILAVDIALRRHSPTGFMVATTITGAGYGLAFMARSGH